MKRLPVSCKLRNASSGGAIIAVCLAAGCASAPEPSDFKTAGQSIAGGQELVAHDSMTSAVAYRLSSGPTGDNPGFSIKGNEDGSIEIGFGGEKLKFTESELRRSNGFSKTTPSTNAGNGIKIGGSTIQLSEIIEGYPKSISDKGERYSQVWKYFIQVDDFSTFRNPNGISLPLNDPRNYNGYAVVGNETPENSMPSDTRAAFVGQAEVFHPHQGGGLKEWGTMRARNANPASEARLNVDFANRTISGQLTGAYHVSANRTDTSYDMALGATTINGNEFTGALVGGGAENGAIYTGKFFGPNADEAAGIIEYVGSRGAGAGAFHTTKQ